VILRQASDQPPAYELYVLDSFADYLCWLEAGCREYGFAVAAV